MKRKEPEEEGGIINCSICHKEIDIELDDFDLCPNCHTAICEECWMREGKCLECGEIL